MNVEELRAQEVASAGGWAAGSLAVVIPVRGSSRHAVPLVRSEAAAEAGLATEDEEVAAAETDVEVSAAAPGSSNKRQSKPQPEPPGDVWKLKGLRAGGVRAGRRMSNPNVVSWNPLGDDRIRRTQDSARYALFVNDLPPLCDDVARERSWSLSAVELFEFADDAGPGDGAGPVTYVVAHVVCRAQALAAIDATVAFFSAPYSRSDQGRARWRSKDVSAFLKAFDIVCADRVGWERPFVISHLVPSGPVPDPSAQLVGAGQRGWSAEQVWAWRLASGANLTTDVEPGWSADAASCDGFWFGSTWCRMTERGVSLVATRALDELPTTDVVEAQVWWRDASRDERRRQNVEHLRVEAFAHRHAVDLSVLAMRQARFLSAHATALSATFAFPPEVVFSQVAADEESGRRQLAEIEASRSSALAMELSLLRFRNDVWFSRVPGDPQASSLLMGLQGLFGSHDLLVEIDAEQRDITRVLGLAAQEAAAELARAQLAAAQAAERAAEATRVQQEQAAADARAAQERARLDRERAAADARQAEKDAKLRRERYDKVVAFVAPAVAVPGVTFAVVQVYQDDDAFAAPFWWGVGLSFAVCVVTWAVLQVLLLRDPDKTKPDDKDVQAPETGGTSTPSGSSAGGARP